jgi:hypothetical protein
MVPVKDPHKPGYRQWQYGIIYIKKQFTRTFETQTLWSFLFWVSRIWIEKLFISTNRSDPNDHSQPRTN